MLADTEARYFGGGFSADVTDECRVLSHSCNAAVPCGTSAWWETISEGTCLQWQLRIE